MKKNELTKKSVEDFVNELNSNGYTIANFVEIANKYQIDISVFQRQFHKDGYIQWNLNDIGIITEKDKKLYFEEYY